jgi:zinc finger protein ADR1
MNIPINYKVSEFGANIVMFAVLQHFYYSKKNQLLNYSAGISPQHSNSSNIINNFRWENLLINENAAISIMLKNISVIRSLLIDLSRVKEMLWSRQWQKLAEEFVGLHCKNDDLLDACDYSIRTLCLIFINDEDSSNFKKSLSLSFQFVFFNFFHIAKFLYKFERRIFKHFKGQAVLKFDELREIPKYFSIYLKIAKFLADLEQIFIKNFDYHDENSKLALKDFDKSRYNFGTFPKLYETEYPKEVNLDQVLKVVKLKLSSNILKIGAFVFNHIFEKEMAFNIFKSLSEALNCIRLHIEREDAY